MFTGIVKDVGIVSGLGMKGGVLALKILTKLPKKYFETGASLMVNGVCLTVESFKNKVCSVSLVKETLDTSNFDKVSLGAKVNLEPALTLNDMLSGHIVAGHVDGVGTVKTRGENFQVIIAKKFLKYFPAKSSICINGVSLTVKSRNANVISVALIPETLKKTNLANLKVGDSVNFEIDILARYVESLNK